VGSAERLADLGHDPGGLVERRCGQRGVRVADALEHEIVQRSEIGAQLGRGGEIERCLELDDDPLRVVERGRLGVDVAGGDRLLGSGEIVDAALEQTLDDLGLGGRLEIDLAIRICGARAP
jgi:hypothetical protein